MFLAEVACVTLELFTRRDDEHVSRILSVVAAVAVVGGEHVLLKTSTQAWIIDVHR